MMFDDILNKIKQKYPSVDFFAFENEYKIYVSHIIVPKDSRGQGIGSDIFSILKTYAKQVNKPIVLSPQPEHGKKASLHKFYKNLGFVKNKGRNKDYVLSEPFALTMLWRPSFKEWLNINI